MDQFSNVQIDGADFSGADLSDLQVEQLDPLSPKFNKTIKFDENTIFANGRKYADRSRISAKEFNEDVYSVASSYLRSVGKEILDDRTFIKPGELGFTIAVVDAKRVHISQLDMPWVSGLVKTLYDHLDKKFGSRLKEGFGITFSEFWKKHADQFEGIEEESYYDLFGGYLYGADKYFSD
jgi:hypothetical protein